MSDETVLRARNKLPPRRNAISRLPNQSAKGAECVAASLRSIVPSSSEGPIHLAIDHLAPLINSSCRAAHWLVGVAREQLQSMASTLRPVFANKLYRNYAP